METIIPMLIAAVVFGLQAYANFQKEQEKARKRNPGQRPTAANPEMPQPSTHGSEKTGKAPDAQPEYEWYPFDQPQPVTSPAFEKYTGTVQAGNTGRKKKTGNQIPSHLQVVEEQVSSGNEVSGYDFDLRDAVIKAAILERPYK